MSEPGKPDEPEDNPLAGVLDRLLARERGAAAAPAELPAAARSGVGVPAVARRVVVVAGIGPDSGSWAFRAACRWLHRTGGGVAALDLEAESSPVDRAADPAGSDAPAVVVPIARMPAGPEGVRGAPPAVQAAVLERLRRHEDAADVLVVRIPSRHRMTLMRGAFLAGGLIVPVDPEESAIADAFAVSREARESFLDLVLHPCGRDREAVVRYLEIMRQFVGAEPRPLDFAIEDPALFLGRLAAPPPEGFATALLVPGTPAPPAGLLELGTIVV